jgi:hypothetical protein
VSRRLRVAIRLIMTVQWRAKFPHVYLGLAVFTIVVFRTLVPQDLIPIGLPLFLFGEPGSLGIFMVAAQWYLEKGEGSTMALSVTPLTSRQYVIGLILGSAITPTVAAALVQAGVQGVDARVLLVIPPLFVTAIISGCIGLMLTTVFPDFTRYIVGSIAPTVLYSIPLLSFVGMAPRWAFRWIPSDAALSIFGSLSQMNMHVTSYVGNMVVLVGFATLFWSGAAIRYETFIRSDIG